LEWYIKERLWRPTSEELSTAAVQGSVPQLDLVLRARYIWFILMQVAHGLWHIHGLKEVHRDLKPQNGKARNENALICSSIFSAGPPLEGS
jgi:serine/threonine protein kinase